MSLVIEDNVACATATTGTGTITLGSAIAGSRSFTGASIADGSTLYYTLRDGSAQETGLGTYTLSGGTVSRDTVYSSTAGGTTKISLSGTATIWLDVSSDWYKNPEIVGAAPSIKLTDTTASAKGLTIYVDGNLADLRESAGASGSLVTLDLANNKMGVGVTLPDERLDIAGYIGFDTVNSASFKKTGTKGLVLDATSSQLDIEWLTSTFGSGYGFRQYALPNGSETEWRLAGRHGSASWTDFLSIISSSGKASFAGDVTLANTKWLNVRNAGNTADLPAFRGTTSDMVEIGTSLFHDELNGWTRAGTPLISYSKLSTGNPTSTSDYDSALRIQQRSSGASHSLSQGKHTAIFEAWDWTFTAVTLAITTATNATPIVITTPTAHSFVDGGQVLIAGVTGNTNANGARFAHVLSSTTFSLYSDSGLTTPVAGNGTYTPVSVSTASNATPILVTTSSPHGYAVNDVVSVWGVTSNSAANGVFMVKTVPLSTTFTLETGELSSVVGVGSGTGGSTGKGFVTNRPFTYATLLQVHLGAGNSRGMGMSGGIANCDDVACLAMINSGAAMGTDCMYIAHGALNYEWVTLFSSDANAFYGIRLGGSILNSGIDLHGTCTLGGVDTKNGTFGTFAYRMGNNQRFVITDTGGANCDAMYIDTGNVLQFYNGAMQVYSSGVVIAHNFTPGYTSTATSGGTTSLTITSNNQQYFTGTLSHTVQLPDVTGLAQGLGYQITNNSTGVITVNSSGSNEVAVLPRNAIIRVTCISTTGSGASSWNVEYLAASAVATLSGSRAPTIDETLGANQSEAINRKYTIASGNVTTLRSGSILRIL